MHCAAEQFQYARAKILKLRHPVLIDFECGGVQTGLPVIHLPCQHTSAHKDALLLTEHGNKVMVLP